MTMKTKIKQETKTISS